MKRKHHFSIRPSKINLVGRASRRLMSNDNNKYHNNIKKSFKFLK